MGREKIESGTEKRERETKEISSQLLEDHVAKIMDAQERACDQAWKNCNENYDGGNEMDDGARASKKRLRQNSNVSPGKKKLKGVLDNIVVKFSYFSFSDELENIEFKTPDKSSRRNSCPTAPLKTCIALDATVTPRRLFG